MWLVRVGDGESVWIETLVGDCGVGGGGGRGGGGGGGGGESVREQRTGPNRRRRDGPCFKGPKLEKDRSFRHERFHAFFDEGFKHVDIGGEAGTDGVG